MRHVRWGTIGLPIWSLLSVRRQDVSKWPSQYGWSLQTLLMQTVRSRAARGGQERVDRDRRQLHQATDREATSWRKTSRWSVGCGRTRPCVTCRRR
ncbi:MAG: hypothetical protein NTZ32_10205 [Planctomycetales bacterium]|nr:hypothetical protein [Planctomycetales bacterium]